MSILKVVKYFFWDQKFEGTCCYWWWGYWWVDVSDHWNSLDYNMKGKIISNPLIRPRLIEDSVFLQRLLCYFFIHQTIKCSYNDFIWWASLGHWTLRKWTRQHCPINSMQWLNIRIYYYIPATIKLKRCCTDRFIFNWTLFRSFFS